jgi:hypothetical protein
MSSEDKRREKERERGCYQVQFETGAFAGRLGTTALVLIGHRGGRERFPQRSLFRSVFHFLPTRYQVGLLKVAAGPSWQKGKNMSKTKKKQKEKTKYPLFPLYLFETLLGFQRCAFPLVRAPRPEAQNLPGLEKKETKKQKTKKNKQRIFLLEN